VVLPGEDAEQYESRLNAWTRHLAPEGPVELYLVQRAVQISWQVDRAERCQTARLAHHARPDENARGTSETAAAADRQAFDDSDAGERLRNHQLACGRMLLKTLDAFATLRLAFAEARVEGALNEAAPPKEKVIGEATESTSKEPAIVEAASPDQPAPTHSLIEEILAGLRSRTDRVTPPSTAGAPIGRDIREAGLTSDSKRNGICPTDAAPGSRVERTPSAERADVRLAQRTAQLPRAADRDASLSGWPGQREKDDRRSNLAHPRIGNGPVRRSSQLSDSGPNEPASRRRVGGYEVPLDTWVPVTGADRAPVRLRSREAREVSLPSNGCMPY
jgi:hypothetical protein